MQLLRDGMYLKYMKIINKTMFLMIFLTFTMPYAPLIYFVM